MSDTVKKTPVVLVLAAWLLIGIPWAWGVDQLWINARKLFISPPPAPAATIAPAATAPAAPASSPAPAAAPSK